MKIKEAIALIEQKDFDLYFHLDEIIHDMCIEYNYIDSDEATRITVAWVDKWLCTDTFVGTKIYFFDGEPFAICYKFGRKSYSSFAYFEKELADKVHVYLLELVAKNTKPTFYIVDINSELLTKEPK